jgi:hypothetical protein
MANKNLFALALVLALVTLACNAVANLPRVVNVRTGPTVTDEINVPAPEIQGTADVELHFGGGEFNLSPGTGGELVSGTATYNVADFKPEVTVDGNNVDIFQGDLDINGIPNFNNVENRWDLSLGNYPMDLTINAGAYKGDFELGGLSLQNLTVKDGAADTTLSFAQPNNIQMGTLRYDTGASQVKLTGLANANFRDMVFNSGAGSYTLDFSGDLQQDAMVAIKTGLSNLEIVVPEGTPASVSLTGGLSNANVYGSWTKSGNDYTLSGSGPELTINVEIGAGNLDLRNP